MQHVSSPPPPCLPNCCLQNVGDVQTQQDSSQLTSVSRTNLSTQFYAAFSFSRHQTATSFLTATLISSQSLLGTYPPACAAPQLSPLPGQKKTAPYLVGTHRTDHTADLSVLLRLQVNSLALVVPAKSSTRNT